MSYVQLTPEDRRQMLAAVGVRRIEDLFVDVPEKARLRGLLDLPAPLSELEMLDELNRLALKNRTVDCSRTFLGCGAYDHFIPTVVDSLAAQNGFLTGYTPYQAEASQGTLQNFFEFQTMVCELAGMDVANASLYEAGTAVVEAVMMARAHTGRPDVVVAETLHPEYRQVLDTYLAEEAGKVRIAPARTGRLNPMALASVADTHTAAVVVQSPNFFGQLEPLAELAQLAKGSGALLVVAFDPLSVGVLKRPGDLGADIAVGEGQPLGIPLQYGGPYLGLMACKTTYMRKLPGRLIGETVDADGRRAFCLTLQTREQHIRREKATSNICTNQGLLATRAAIYMSAVGRQGLKRVAELCAHKAHYAASRIAALNGYTLRFDGPFFKEFVVVSRKPVAKVLAHCRGKGVLAGVPLVQWYPELKDCFAVAVTEKRTRADIDALVEALASVP
jgi:glycine dehydrogenase subunit 1